MELDVVELLEKKVESFMGRYSALKGENERLTDIVKSKDKEIEELARKVERLSKEKGLIREKVENIMERVEGLIQTA